MKRVVRPEEHSLWQTAMQGVRRMVTAPVAEPVIDTAPKPVLAAPEIQTARTKPQAVDPPRSALPRFLDSETSRRLKTREARIDARLDLHGMTEAAAFTALSGFIEESSAAGRRVVLIITGKGRMGRGLLRQSLPLWLESPALRPHIAAIQTALHPDGGDGALYVQMRRR